MVPTPIRRAARRLLGDRYESAQGLWHRVTARSRRKDAAARRALVERHLQAHPPQVLRGPFAGLRYPAKVAQEDPGVLPKLLGTFEQELTPAIERAISEGPALVVNIGAAEGFYAVGLARRLEASEVIAFEMDEAAAERLTEIAELNGVTERIRLRGRCTTGELSALDLDGSLVVCDCEGCELALIDPQAAPGLARSSLIVELHDFVDPGISRAITSRFAETHEVEVVSTTSRDPAAVPELNALAHDDAALALDEHRPGRMEWAILRPKKGEQP